MSWFLWSLVALDAQAQSKPAPPLKAPPEISQESPSPEQSEETPNPNRIGDPDAIEPESNPLNPAGDSLDKLIQLRINDDVWKSMLGELPCLETAEACIKELQTLAIQNSSSLAAIDERVQIVEQKIEEARKNNQDTIRLGVFEPLVQSYLKLETIPGQNGQPARQRGFLDRIFSIFAQPLSGINEVLSLIGVPLFKNMIGGGEAAQARTIAITDLQVKVAEIQRQRGELADKTREAVIMQVLDFDVVRRDFQVSQEIARREVLRAKLVEVDYRFTAEVSTQSYLSNLSSLDQQKAQTYRAWARMRSQMTRIKLLVLGAEDG
ncbi:hypothetical protein H6F43_03570 [Leptolyngbya sp. FACHB-36]|uniref:hypothetical protein n=1 Tax=Leptolyngbya sp. FACHB-36 TaxID=2692808 RepID=UPI0016813FCB|nr:hypothetical protein [Leptolyngbya sp. FACHB-36]MBD2019261.1 hypothetical protein [Leptolyngbya sp. FACHB-36]